MCWVETHTLISYAYENYEIKKVLSQNAILGRIPVVDSDTTLPVVVEEEIEVLTRKENALSYRFDWENQIAVDQVADGLEVGHVTLTINDEVTDLTYPLVIDWDGTPISVRSPLEKQTESVKEAVTGIFRTDRAFVIALILLLAVIGICIPALKISRVLHEKKIHRPKH
jgi:hypothetical protein